METKKCTRCKKEKPIGDFSFRNKKTGERQYICKDCQNILSTEHYYKYRQKYIDKAANRRSIVLPTLIEKMTKYLLGHPCVDCGETDFVVLDFDHVRGEKRDSVFILMTKTLSWDTVLSEIDKCEVRCANCHRRITAKRSGNWWKSAYNNASLA